jgi:hypothetical protein
MRDRIHRHDDREAVGTYHEGPPSDPAGNEAPVMWRAATILPASCSSSPSARRRRFLRENSDYPGYENAANEKAADQAAPRTGVHDTKRRPAC